MRVSWSMMATAALALAAAAGARAQGPGQGSARVETIPLSLTAPERYQVPIVLEPSREVDVAATVDGVVTVVQGQVGATVRDRQEVAQLDRAEAAAHLKIAQATLKEQEAALESAKQTKAPSGQVAQAEARVEAAAARVDLAQIGVDRCTLRAPFAGRLLEVFATPGQYVERGEPIARLAEVSSLRAIVPVPKSTEAGANVKVFVEGREVEGRVQSVIPMPSSFAELRELYAPLAAAWVVLPNAGGKLEPGQRLTTGVLPDAPLAIIPSQAIRVADLLPARPARGTGKAAATAAPEPEPGSEMVQVLRNEYVAEVPVRVLGTAGPERVQVCGPFRPADLLIVSSSVTLVPGTLVRMPGAPARETFEAVAPDPNAFGAPAQVAIPGRTPGGVAPIGPPGSAVPGARPTPGATQPAPAATKPRAPTKPAVPF